MGLDTVELVMEIEERFGIELSDKELGKISTVGDFYELVSRLCITQDTPGNCDFQRAFYRLKKTIISELKFERNKIKPQTKTIEIFPETKRNERWNRISKASGLSFPGLVFPKKLLSITSILSFLFWVAIVSLLLGFAFLFYVPSLYWKFTVFLFVSLAIIVFIIIFRNFPFVKEIPDSC